VTLRDGIVGVQLLTFVTLAAYFCRDGLWRLGLAQFGYAVITAILFIGVSSRS